MAVALLAVIYVVFIGLGVPDSALGPAWPAVYADLDIAVGAGGLITIVLALGTIVSGLLTPRLVAAMGTGLLTVVSTGLTAAGLLLFAGSESLTELLLACIPLGLGAGAIDTALNSYAAANYNASQMSFLHCFYGIGVTVSPILLGYVLMEHTWRDGYTLLFGVQLAITILALATLPLWKRVPNRLADVQGGRSGLGPIQALRTRGVRFACLVFVATCGIEFTCGTWGSTYLVLEKGMNAADAAGMLTLYYAGIAVGRFLSGLLVRRITPRRLLYVGEGIVTAGIVLLFLPVGAWTAAFFLFLIGFGNGPIYPNMMYLTPDNFGLAMTEGAMSAQIASSYVSNMMIPTVFGLAGEAAGFWLLPVFLVVMAAVLVWTTLQALPRSEERKEELA